MCCLCAFTLFTSQRSTVYPGCPSQGRGPRIFFPETRNVPRLHYCKSRGHKPRIIPVQYERVNSYRCANCIASRCRVSSYYTATQHAAVPGTSYLSAGMFKFLLNLGMITYTETGRAARRQVWCKPYLFVAQQYKNEGAHRNTWTHSSDYD